SGWGHHPATGEKESDLVAQEKICGGAVVGKTEKVKGEIGMALGVVKGFRPEGEKGNALAEEFKVWVSNQIGKIARQ
ncbi:AMP-binding enzyme, partial [[Pasteurella] aerogenes]